MSYVLEWRLTGSKSDGLSIVRQVRVFRNAGGLKTFLRSRRFRRLAAPELRIQLRARDADAEEVITTIDAAMTWDPGSCSLPPPLLQSQWERELSALSVRAMMIDRWREELHSAQQLGLLNVEQIRALLGALEAMLVEGDPMAAASSN